MPKPATGELCRIASGWEARITIKGRVRRAFVLENIAVDDEPSAVARCAALADMATRLRKAGHADKAATLLDEGATAVGYFTGFVTRGPILARLILERLVARH